jgi:hypothetical protein
LGQFSEEGGREKVSFTRTSDKALCLSGEVVEAKELKNDLTFWEKMNRREGWDRTFEKKLRATSAEARRVRLGDNEKMIAKEKLELERQGEDKSRLEWDAGQAKQNAT